MVFKDGHFRKASFSTEIIESGSSNVSRFSQRLKAPPEIVPYA